MSELLFTADIDIKILDQKIKKIEEGFTAVARDAAQAGSVMDKIFKQAATDSINGMVLKLNELQKAYNDLSAADRETQGAGLTSQINSLSDSIDIARNQFVVLETAASGSIDSMVTKLSELQRQFTALSASDRGGDVGIGLQKEIQLLAASIEEAKSGFVSMEQVAEDSINGMITKLLELQRQYNNLSASDRITLGSGMHDQMIALGNDIENAKKQFVSLANVSEDSIQGMTVKLQELNRQFNQLSAADRGGSVGIKMAQDMAVLSNEIENANMKMRAMAGQAKSSTSSMYGLSYSVQQIGRELPNIAYGFPLFIMAISNNLPILTDSISMARKENELLKQSGQASTPVWKQVAGSIFSWQTAMILGVTAMTVFGAKIPGLVQDLFSMGKGLKLTSEELKGLNESFAKSAGSEIGKLKTLFDALGNAKEGTVEYTEAKGAIIDQYGKNMEGMNAEIRSLNDVKGAYEELTKAIYETAKAKSLQDLRADLGEKLVKNTTPEFEKLSKLLTGGIGEVYKETIMDAARFGKELSYDAQRVVDSFTYKKQDVIGQSITGAVQYGKPYDFNPVVESMNKIKKTQDDTNKSYKEGEKYADLMFGNNTQAKVKDLIKEQEDLLKIAKLKPQGTPAELEAKNKEIKAIEDQIKAYKELGVEKEKGAGKMANEELAKAREALTNAIIANNQKEITFQAAKIALLERELELRKWIAYEAIGFAKGDITQTDRNTANNPAAIVTKGISPIIKKGVLGTNAKGQVIEITAVDKTGPTLKKIGLETEKLNKKVKKDNEQAAKDQEKLDKENLDRKMDQQEAILNYSRQFTSELIDQLGLTEDQNKVLNGMADTVANLASGFLTGNPTDFIAAAFSGVSALMSAITGPKTPQLTTLEKMNNLLEQQSIILANLSGSNYFELAEKQIGDYAKAIEETNSKIRESIKKRPLGGVVPSGSLDDLWKLQNILEKDSGIDGIAKAWTRGLLILDETQISMLDKALEDRKSSIELLGNTFREALGFDSSDVSDSIFSGIEEGLKLGENSLGGFAQSFGDLMKKALMQAITESVNTDITTTFLPKVKELLQNNEVGPSGEKITEKEQLILENLYGDSVKKGQELTDAIKPILDKYGTSSTNSSKPLTGITASLTEDTGSLLAGLITGMRIDTKEMGIDIRSMLNFSQNQLEIMDQQLSVMSQVERNTRPLSRLEAIENGIKEMNTNIKNLG